MFYNAAGMLIGLGLVAGINRLLGSDKLGIALAVNYVLLECIAALFLFAGRKYAVRTVSKQTGHSGIYFSMNELFNKENKTLQQSTVSEFLRFLYLKMNRSICQIKS